LSGGDTGRSGGVPRSRLGGPRGPWWRHQGLVHGRAGRGRISRRSHPRSGRFRGCWWTCAARLSALHGSHSRESRAPGVRVHRGARTPECSGARRAGRLPDFELARRRREGSARAGGDTGEGSGGSVRSCRGSAGTGTHRWSNSEREVKGHERAAAVVHPIKASPRAQDREDRKRSRREHLTNTGARFAGRALCSSSQRDERRLCRRRRRQRS
jgi:hypothetical protein